MDLECKETTWGGGLHSAWLFDMRTSHEIRLGANMTTLGYATETPHDHGDQVYSVYRSERPHDHTDQVYSVYSAQPFLDLGLIGTPVLGHSTVYVDLPHTDLRVKDMTMTSVYTA